MYYSTKTYGDGHGLSCAFRQWKADSHCRYTHGYSLQFKFVFVTETLDNTGWCVDFGNLKGLRSILEDNFDHKTLVAEDDPYLEEFKRLHNLGVIDLNILPAVGCEKFAEFVFEVTEIWLIDNGYSPRVKLHSVEISEHGANSAIYTNESRYT